MLSNIVMAALAQEPDVVVVGGVSADKDLATQVGLARADAVILQTNRPGAAANFTDLLHAFPVLKVVAIDPTGRRGFLHQLRPYSIRVAEVSVDALLSALRQPLTPIRRTARP